MKLRVQDLICQIRKNSWGKSQPFPKRSKSDFYLKKKSVEKTLIVVTANPRIDPGINALR